MEMDLIRHIVTTIFNNWSALQLAVEHGLGTRDDALQIVDYITETLRINDGLTSEEIADVLAEAMDSLFQTICEDNSCEEIGLLLSKFMKFAKEETEDFVLSELNKLPRTQVWLSKPIKKQRTKLHFEDQPMELGDDAIPEEDSGWQEVKSKRNQRVAIN